MQKLLIKFSVILLFLTLAINSSYSQNALKAKERIMQLKKIKLLEILNLDEQGSQNFLVKYSSYEKKVEEKKVALDFAVEELETAVRKKQSKDELSSKTQKVLQAQKEFIEILEETSRSIKSILNEENYAKFLIFEHKFKDEIQKIIMNKMKRLKD
jgi:hypothetical protein